MKTIIASAVLMISTFAFGLAYADSDELPTMFPYTPATRGDIVHESLQPRGDPWTVTGDELPVFVSTAAPEDDMAEAKGSAAGGVSAPARETGLDGELGRIFDQVIGAIGSDLP